MRPIQIKCPIFQRTFLVFHNCSEDKFQSYIGKKFKISIPDIARMDGLMTCVYKSNKEVIILWTRNQKNKALLISTLAHECSHATNHVLYEIGHRHDLDNDEFPCYYVGFLIKKVLECCA